MRTETYSGITIRYPDEVCFAFNPNHIYISGADANSMAEVSFTHQNGTKKEVTASLVGSENRINISKMLQILCFDRSNGVNVNIKVTDLDGDTVTFTLSFVVISGSIEIGERLNNVGSYVIDNEERAFIRRIRWFKNYPMKVSMFSHLSTMTFRTKYDAQSYGAAQSVSKSWFVGFADLDLKTLFPYAQRSALIYVEGDGVSTFDTSFDYTFKDLSETAKAVSITLDDAKEGHYLRWVDQMGQLQYFLFSRGFGELKVQSDEEIEDDITFNGMEFGGVRQKIQKEKSRSLNVCAVDLDEYELEYVMSIAATNECSMYLGKNKMNEEIWIPVNVKDETYTINEKNDRFDFDIKIELPTSQSQTR